MISIRADKGRIGARTAFLNAVVSRFMLIAMTFLGARYLSIDDFGVFALIMSTASSIATLSAVGVGVVNNSTASRHYEDDPRFVSAVFTGVLLVCLLLSVLFALAFLPPMISVESGFSGLELLAILFAVSALMTVASASEGLAYGLRRIGTMLTISVVVLIIAPAATVWFILSAGLVGAIAALILFRLLQSGLLFLALLMQSRIRLAPGWAWQDRRRVGQLFVTTSLPLAGAALLAAPVTTVAMFLLQRDSGTDQVAVFALAYQVFLMIIFPPGAMGHFLLSRLAAKGADGRATLAYSMRYLMVYGLFGMAIMTGATFAMPLVAPAVPIDISVMVSFGLAAFFYILTIGYNNYWSSVGEARMVFLGQICWAIPFLLVTYLGASKYGALAVTAGFLAGAIVQLAFNIVLYVRRG